MINLLLVGCGKWGKNILRVIKTLEEEKRCNLKGVVVSTQSSVKFLEFLGVKAFTLLPGENLPLEGIDGVIIATPPHTHYQYIAQCLPLTNVFVEKPLVTNDYEVEYVRELADKHQNHVLMVGHIWRYDEMIQKFKRRVIELNSEITFIEGSFVSPIDSRKNSDPVLEHLHLFDLLDYTFGKLPEIMWSSSKLYETDCFRTVDWRYDNLDGHWAGLTGLTGKFDFGWKGNIKKRELKIQTKNALYEYDLSLPPTQESEPLKLELLHFIKACERSSINYPDVSIGLKVTEKAIKTIPDKNVKWIPRVAVIGGGIFGSTAAAFMPTSAQVSVFDTHGLFRGASMNNQFRHHEGFHYPRSKETILSIQEAKNEFKLYYGDCIVNVPSFYGISNYDSKTSADEFRKNFTDLCIKYKEIDPKDVSEFINPASVETVFLTDEGVYHPGRLVNRALGLMYKMSNVHFHENTQVVGVDINRNGTKELQFLSSNGKILHERFDYVINATYNKTNFFRRLMNFTPQQLTYRLKEIVVVEIPGRKSMSSATIIDGDFATLLPIPGTESEYTLGDVPLSIHWAGNEEELQNLPNFVTKTHWPLIQDRCSYWFPELKNAIYKRSMFSILPIQEQQMLTDGRPTIVDYHGFGCWSIFSGKIIEAVKAARIIRESL